MLQVRGRFGSIPCARLLCVALIWLGVMFFLPLLPTHLEAVLGMVFALVGTPVACWLSLGGLLSTRSRVACVGLSALGVLTYLFTYLIPPPSIVAVSIWVCGGVEFLAALLFVTKGGVGITGDVRRQVATVAAALWWICWGFGAAAAIPLVHHNGGWKAVCETNLKQVGIAFLSYRCTYHREPTSVDQLVKAGFLSARDARCPLGGEYVRLAVRRHSRDAFIFICPNHYPYMLALTRECAVWVLQRRHSRGLPKIGPNPWRF